MQGIHPIMEEIRAETGCSTVFTYPGTPGQYAYEYVLDHEDMELRQAVREQHLLHLAQTHYYRTLEEGDPEIPVVIVSGDMGEGMASQPLIAGSLSAPMLIIVAEPMLEHNGNALNTFYQTDRGSTPEKLDDDSVLHEHDNVEDRMLFRDMDQLDDLTSMINRLWETHGIGILHLPAYAHQEPAPETEDVTDWTPDTLTADELQDRWESAERPLLYVGRGVKHPDVRDRIQELAEQTGAVITSSWHMDGYFDDNYAGCIGICGTPSANEAFFQSDLVVALGTSINITQTSTDPATIAAFQDKVVQVEESTLRDSTFVNAWAQTDIDTALDTLAGRTGDCWTDIDDYGLDRLDRYVPDRMQAAGELIRDEYDDRMITLGVGNAMVWLPAVIGPDVRKDTSRSVSMGEIAAGLNWEDNPIIFVGDGEFEMDLSILLEARHQDADATFIVTWNKRLGLVTERQEQKVGEVLTPKQNYVDYNSIGTGINGVQSHVPETPDAVKATLRDCIDNDRVDIVAIPIEETLSSDLFSLDTLPRMD